MDHVINAMQPYYDVTLEWFLSEQRSREYKSISDNPYYEELMALINSMNIIRGYLGWENIILEDELELYIGEKKATSHINSVEDDFELES